MTLYFTFTLRFFNFYFRPNQPGHSNFFSFPCCTRNTLVLQFSNISFAQSARTFSLLEPLLSQTAQNTILFWLQIIPRGTLSKSPSKSTSAATETQFSSAMPRSKDLYFPSQTPLPSNNDPLKQSIFLLSSYNAIFLNYY